MNQMGSNDSDYFEGYRIGGNRKRGSQDKNKIKYNNNNKKNTPQLF